MKKYIILIIKKLFAPLLWCYHTIQDAPVINFDNELLGFSDWRNPRF